MAHLLNDPPPNAKRIVTGWHSFDRVWKNRNGEIGVPMYAMELYGPPSSGKSTFAYSLAGIVAQQLKKNIGLGDIEGTDSNTVLSTLQQVGFTGGLYWFNGDGKKKRRKVSGDFDDEEVEEDAIDENILDEIISKLRDPDMGVTIFDSVGAVSPIYELNNPSTSQNMGRRAQLIARHSRKLMHIIRNDPKLCIYTNHIHQNIGFVGTHTTAGMTLKFLTALQIAIQRDQSFPKKKEEAVAYTIKGTVSKDKFGYDKRVFHVFVLSGLGVHHGLTAMYDCYNLKLIESAGAKFKIKSTGELVPGTKKLTELALSGETEPFQIFYDLLNKLQPDVEETVDEGEENQE